ncbi:hypothetical protein [Hydrogenophaga flava]|uniref:hypothetical protein n=1 Tax=Hydrogenophaga flava TaxID=65657 RepID=UPI000AE67F9B|nr:hypothetical protein [Hydrogenophaga flava]
MNGVHALRVLLHLNPLGVARYGTLAQPDALGDSGRERVLFGLTRIASPYPSSGLPL